MGRMDQKSWVRRFHEDEESVRLTDRAVQLLAAETNGCLAASHLSRLAVLHSNGV